MTTNFGIFNAVFGLDDQASAKLKAIRTNTHALNRVALNTTKSVQKIGASLKEVTKGVPKLAIKDFEKRAFEVGKRLEELSIQGRVSSSSLRTLSQKLLVAADSAGTEFATSLKFSSRQLANLSAELRVGEQNVGKVINRFQFMGDVSDATALKMRAVSASAQGMMLGMSALDKNIIGLTFSLIFLQFSGALKLSLGFAAATVAAGLMFKQFQKIQKQKKEAKDLSNQMAIATGGTQAYGIAMAEAAVFAEDLQLNEKHTEEATRALGKGLVILRDRGLDPSRDALKVFASGYLIARANGKSMEEGVEAGTAALGQFSDATLEAGNIIGKEFEDMELRGGRALGVIQAQSRGLMGDMEDLGKRLLRIGEFVVGLDSQTYSAWGSIAGATAKFIKGVVFDGLKVTQEEAKNLEDTIEAGPKIFEDAFGSMGEETGGLLKEFTALDKAISDFEGQALSYFGTLSTEALDTGKDIQRDLFDVIDQARLDLIELDNQKELFNWAPSLITPTVVTDPSKKIEDKIEEELTDYENRLTTGTGGKENVLPKVVLKVLQEYGGTMDARELQFVQSQARGSPPGTHTSSMGRFGLQDATMQDMGVGIPVIGGGGFKDVIINNTFEIKGNKIGTDDDADDFGRRIARNIKSNLGQVSNLGAAF